VDEIRKWVSYLVLLKPTGSTLSFDPKPIEVGEERKALLEAAKNPVHVAMILIMLSCAMYIAEATRVEWSEIKKGYLVTCRKETGECAPPSFGPRRWTPWRSCPYSATASSREGAPLGVKGAEKHRRLSIVSLQMNFIMKIIVNTNLMGYHI